MSLVVAVLPLPPLLPQPDANLGECLRKTSSLWRGNLACCCQCLIINSATIIVYAVGKEKAHATETSRCRMKPFVSELNRCCTFDEKCKCRTKSRKIGGIKECYFSLPRPSSPSSLPLLVDVLLIDAETGEFNLGSMENQQPIVMPSSSLDFPSYFRTTPTSIFLLFVVILSHARTPLFD